MVYVLKYSNGKIFQQENHVDNASDISVWWPVMQGTHVQSLFPI